MEFWAKAALKEDYRNEALLFLGKMYNKVQKYKHAIGTLEDALKNTLPKDRAL